MKRFWLFVHDTYYASGGMEDFFDSFETAEEAAARGRLATTGGNGYKFENWEVFDSYWGVTVLKKWDGRAESDLNFKILSSNHSNLSVSIAPRMEPVIKIHPMTEKPDFGVLVHGITIYGSSSLIHHLGGEWIMSEDQFISWFIGWITQEEAYNAKQALQVLKCLR